MSYNAYFYRTKSSVMDTADGYPFEALSGESLIFLTALYNGFGCWLEVLRSWLSEIVMQKGDCQMQNTCKSRWSPCC